MSYDYSQQKKLIQTSEYSCLKEIENMLNGSFNFKNFAACLPEMHHTLQQRFFRLVKECILFMAGPGNVAVDDRNRASYEMCRDLAEIVRNRPLPFI